RQSLAWLAHTAHSPITNIKRRSDRDTRCLCVTVQLQFYDTAQAFRLRRTPQARSAGSASPCRTSSCVSSMASAPNPGPSATTAVLASVAALGIWRLLAVAAPHLAALVLMYETETDFGARLSFALAWGILNFFRIPLLRRPALSGALSLTMVVVLVLLSRLKHDVVQMTVNFIDLMMIDRDTVA